MTLIDIIRHTSFSLFSPIRQPHRHAPARWAKVARPQRVRWRGEVNAPFDSRRKRSLRSLPANRHDLCGKWRGHTGGRSEVVALKQAALRQEMALSLNPLPCGKRGRNREKWLDVIIKKFLPLS